MGDVYEDLANYLKADDRSEYRVEIPKLTVFRLRQMALVEAARTKKRVTWLSLLERAANELVNKNDIKAEK